MSTELTFDLYQTVTNRIIELLETGTIPWKKPWASSGPPMNALTKRCYQGINLWLLLTLNYESNLFLTFEQLKKVGGSVNKGEKGHMVVYWLVPEKTDLVEEQEEKHKEQNGKRPFLRYHKVFNLDQCSGIPSSLTTSTPEQHANPIQACDAIVLGMPKRPEIKFGKREAFYSIPGDYVNMPRQKTFASNEAYYATLFHELVHSTGHEKRLKRKTVMEMAEFGSEPYSMEELIAEIGSCYLANVAGTLQTTMQNNAAYIKGWLMKLKGDKRFIIQASSHAQRAVDFILNVQKHVEKDKAALIEQN